MPTTTAATATMLRIHRRFPRSARNRFLTLTRPRGGSSDIAQALLRQGWESWPGALSTGLVGGTRRDHRTVGGAEDVEGDDAQQEDAEQRGERSPFVRPIASAKSVSRASV